MIGLVVYLRSRRGRKKSHDRCEHTEGEENTQTRKRPGAHADEKAKRLLRGTGRGRSDEKEEKVSGPD